MDVFTEARTGKLTQAELEAYLKNGGDINARNPQPGFCLLTEAIRGGSLSVVKLLLSHGADVSRKSGYRELYPIWMAATGRRNRAAMVELLLEKGANPDDTMDDCDNDTPLMAAIAQNRDTKVISALVDAGASLSRKNDLGETAQELAERANDTGVLAAICPKDQRPLARPALITAIASLILFILSYVNSGTIKTIVMDTVSSLYHITKDATPDAELAKEIHEPKTVDEFKASIDKYVTDSGLGQFFGSNPRFLQEVPEKATRLRKDPNNNLTREDQIRDLTRLALYQPVLYCGEISSMLKPRQQRNS